MGGLIEEIQLIECDHCCHLPHKNDVYVRLILCNFRYFSRDNVCVEREEDISEWERPGSFSASGSFSVNFETCEDMPTKHVCTTV